MQERNKSAMVAGATAAMLTEGFAPAEKGQYRLFVPGVGGSVVSHNLENERRQSGLCQDLLAAAAILA
jgi:hypothetical protein